MLTATCSGNSTEKLSVLRKAILHNGVPSHELSLLCPYTTDSSKFLVASDCCQVVEEDGFLINVSGPLCTFLYQTKDICTFLDLRYALIAFGMSDQAIILLEKKLHSGESAIIVDCEGTIGHDIEEDVAQEYQRSNTPSSQSLISFLH